MPSKISILMSTYNGEKYLSQQIDSILHQSYKDWNLYIRDDGSTDNTLQIIVNYCTSYSNIYCLQDPEHRGACMSFLWLLEQIESEYYMFCDQDDVWLANKILLSLEKMKETEFDYPDVPILVHTDLKVVNKDLKEKNPSFWMQAKLNQLYLSKFNYAGVCNGVTGCTLMINNKAKQLAFPLVPLIPMHDYWIFLNVAKNGKIVPVYSATILYRQHGKNEVGAQNINSVYYFNRVKKIKKTVKKQWQMYKFLKHLNYGSLLKYYCYKIYYTVIRNL